MNFKAVENEFYPLRDVVKKFIGHEIPLIFCVVDKVA